MFKTKTLKNPKRLNKRTLITFMLIFAAIGGYLIYKSFAATGPLVSQVEAELMSLSGVSNTSGHTGYGIGTDPNASGGKYVWLDSTNGLNSGSTAAYGTLTSSVSFSNPVSSLSINAEANDSGCPAGTSGIIYPTITVSLDGQILLNQQAFATHNQWSTFNYNFATPVASGTHQLQIVGNTFGGVSPTGHCAANLSLDVSKFYGLLTTTARTTVYQFIDPTTFYITPSGSTTSSPAVLVSDAIYAGGSVQVANLNVGDVLTWGGKGGSPAPNSPTFVSSKYCFTVRTTGTSVAKLQVGTNTIVVKPSPVVGSGQFYWQYNCVANTTLGTIKLLSGGQLRMYRIEIPTVYAY